jgi:SAM-dependent methyltransferase
MVTSFDKYALQGDYHWREASRMGLRFNAPLVSRYNSVLKRIPLEANEILDFGCGDGYLTCLIARLTPRSLVTGLDGDRHGINVAQRRASRIPNVRFQLSETLALPFTAGTFDVIIMADVIEHLPDFKASLSEIRRVLRPRGTLIISTPHRQPTGKWDERHVFEFSASELRTEVANLFESVELFGSWPMPYFRAWRRKGLGRILLDVTARLGWNAFDREVRDADASYGQLLVTARGPEF